MSGRIFVGNLSYETTKTELAALLAEAGTVTDVFLPADRETGRPRGFAFVQFASEAEAAAAIRLFEARELGGRRLKVNAAEARPSGPAPPRSFRPPSSPAAPPPFDGFAPPPGGRPFKAKGSRRNLRARKRSL